jgi:hypothetical protein
MLSWIKQTAASQVQLHQHQHIHRISVFTQRVWYETVVVRIDHRRVQHPVNLVSVEAEQHNSRISGECREEEDEQCRHKVFG